MLLKWSSPIIPTQDVPADRNRRERIRHAGHYDYVYRNRHGNKRHYDGDSDSDDYGNARGRTSHGRAYGQSTHNYAG